jgi:PilZ domain
MPAALLCAPEGVDLGAELQSTALSRGDFEWIGCSQLAAAKAAFEKRVDLVVIDRELAWALPLVRWMRGSPETAAVPALVASRGGDPTRDRELAAAGAHAVLRLPAGREWDGCLSRLLPFAVRVGLRVPVHFRVSGRIAATREARTGTALDVSEAGMLLEATDLALGDELHLVFQVPGRSVPTSVPARVVRRAAHDRWGLALAPTRDDFVRQIRALAASLRGGDGSDPL